MSAARTRRRQAVRPGPPGGLRATNRAQRELTIRDAALTLFLERGLDAVSVDDIMQRAQMAKGSFYRYFESHEALVAAIMAPAEALVLRALEVCRKALARAATKDAQIDAYRTVGAVVASLLMEYPGQVRLYLQECRAPNAGARRPIVSLAERITWYALDITRRAQTHGILKPIPVAVSALTVVGAAERLLHAVLQEEDIGNPLEVPEQLTRLILDGLKAEGVRLPR